MLLMYSDIYVSCVSSAHNVTSKGFYLVIVSTTVETEDPEGELTPGLDLLAPIKEKYVYQYLLALLHFCLDICAYKTFKVCVY